MEADGAPSLWLLLIVSELSRLRRLRGQLPASSGLRPVVACSLREGARLLESHPIDVIVADLSLPDARGLEVVRRLRAWAPGLPLIVLSEGAEVSVQALEAGAQDYLSLSGGHRTLPESVGYALERKRSEEVLRVPPAPGQVEVSEIVSLRGGLWGHQVRGRGGDAASVLDAALRTLTTGHVLVEVELAWLTAPGSLREVAVLPGAARVVLGVAEVGSAASASGLPRFRAAGGQVFALGVGERPLGELVAMPLDGLVLAPSVCALAQERRGAPLVRAVVSLAEECGWAVLGTGEVLRFLGCRLIRREEWSGLQ